MACSQACLSPPYLARLNCSRVSFAWPTGRRCGRRLRACFPAGLEGRMRRGKKLLLLPKYAWESVSSVRDHCYLIEKPKPPKAWPEHPDPLTPMDGASLRKSLLPEVTRVSPRIVTSTLRI